MVYRYGDYIDAQALIDQGSCHIISREVMLAGAQNFKMDASRIVSVTE